MQCNMKIVDLIKTNESKIKNYFRENHSLTNTPCEVVYLCMTGISTLEIADKIGISEKTVKFHITNINQKLNNKKRKMNYLLEMPLHVLNIKSNIPLETGRRNDT